MKRSNNRRGKLYTFTGFFIRGLRALALSDCKKCYGTGQVGRNVSVNQYVGCRCVKTVELPISWMVL